MTLFATDADLRRWEREGRRDLLDGISAGEKLWAGDRIVDARGTRLTSCPYLVWTGDRAACSIYQTRPHVCRDFAPGSSLLCPQGDRRPD
jgi:Fe-S-cluster containining protein